jgi:hypothetical protein
MEPAFKVTAMKKEKWKVVREVAEMSVEIQWSTLQLSALALHRLSLKSLDSGPDRYVILCNPFQEALANFTRHLLLCLACAKHYTSSSLNTTSTRRAHWHLVFQV